MFLSDKVRLINCPVGADCAFGTATAPRGSTNIGAAVCLGLLEHNVQWGIPSINRH